MAHFVLMCYNHSNSSSLTDFTSTTLNVTGFTAAFHQPPKGVSLLSVAIYRFFK